MGKKKYPPDEEGGVNLGVNQMGDRFLDSYRHTNAKNSYLKGNRYVSEAMF